MPLGDRAYGSPFHTDGSVNEAWVTKLQTFFSDLKSYGVQRVIPTVVFASDWSGDASNAMCPSPGDSPTAGGCFPYQTATLDTCEGNPTTLRFYPWMPYGFLPDGSISGTLMAQGYNCAAPNPNFWGWDKFVELYRRILVAAGQAQVKVSGFTPEAEINVTVVPTSARAIYDNTANGYAGYDVFGNLRATAATV